MASKKDVKECTLIMQKLLNVMRTNIELTEFLIKFLKNFRKCENRELMSDAINVLFTEDCFFTKDNLSLFKRKIKEIVPPKCMQGKELDLKNLYNEMFIGSGGFSVVFLCEYINDNKKTKVAVKKLDTFLINSEDMMTEVYIMCKLSHPNLLPIIGYNLKGYVIITPFMKYGQLFEVCQLTHSNKQLYKYLIDVIDGLAYLHDNKYIHRDLTVRNVLVDDKKNCKIGDFGLVVKVGKKGMFYSERHIYAYHLAPETSKTQIFSLFSDVFSLGVLIWEVMSCPNILFLPDLEYPEKTERCPEALFDVIQKSLASNPKDRPALKQIKDCVETLLK
ncbi:tyrosine-protein kinase SRK3-like [Aethina tumida]|uniref:tyrosine-protein kinase SRK3-like n=1 Tax=Aethina tumida TaxID=116153 RepID=UPI00214996F6|nr:tyrosine-protein kinase SRK3-like [Aethina tumida]